MSRIWTLLTVAAALLAPVALRAQTNDSPLPSLQTVLAHAAEAVAREDFYHDILNTRYVYERTRVSETRTSRGKLKDREEKFNTNNPPLELACQPVPPYRPPTAAEAAAARERKKKQLVDVTDLVTNVLAYSRMQIVGREMVNGRSALVVDFLPPAKRIRERDLMDRIVNRTAGRAWVDEEDYTLTRLQAHLVDRLLLFAGFGAILNGNYSFDRERTPEGVWYSRDTSYEANVREFILYRNLTYHEAFTNVCRPQPARLAAIRSPARTTPVYEEGSTTR